MFEDLNIQELDESDPKIKQVRRSSELITPKPLFSYIVQEYSRECKGQLRDIRRLSWALHSIRLCRVILICRPICCVLGAFEQLFRNSSWRLQGKLNFKWRRRVFDLFMMFTSPKTQWFSCARPSGVPWRSARKTPERGSLRLNHWLAYQSWQIAESSTYLRKWGIYLCLLKNQRCCMKEESSEKSYTFIYHYECFVQKSSPVQVLIDFTVDFYLLSIYIFLFSAIFSVFSSTCCGRELTEIMSTELKLIIFVMLEHFLLLVAWLIHKAIPDRPSSVRTALSRADYESKLALKREVLNHLYLMFEIGFFICMKSSEIWNRKK